MSLVQGHSGCTCAAVTPRLLLAHAACLPAECWPGRLWVHSAGMQEKQRGWRNPCRCHLCTSRPVLSPHAEVLEQQDSQGSIPDREQAQRNLRSGCPKQGQHRGHVLGDTSTKCQYSHADGCVLWVTNSMKGSHQPSFPAERLTKLNAYLSRHVPAAYLHPP